jgi:cytidylate kinase
MPPRVIAIDGPAGSGKTVIGKRVADALGYLYLDTGAFYRALTWLAVDKPVDVHDGVALATLARGAHLEIHRSPIDDGWPYSVYVDGRDITRELTSPEVTNNVSIVAAHPEVRAELLPAQRRVAQQGLTVMAGRDIGTVVCPFAELKFFLKAPLPIRVARRIQQLEALGLAPDPEQVAAEMAERDRIDQSREVAPLRPATDAIIIDTSAMSVDEEIALILDLVARRAP